MAEMFIAKLPRCPTHGQMNEDLPRDLWMCHGYDGEGCNYTVTNEEWHKTFRTIGYIDDGEFGFRWNLE
jgi:hypothetical protein